MKKNSFIIPIFVPHEGCPNDCVFCNQKKITGQKNSYDFKKVRKIIEEHLQTINLEESSTVEIAFYGGTFTAIEIELQEEFLKVASEYVQKYALDGIRLSTRPDALDSYKISVLKKYGVRTIELGVQSLDNTVLSSANRGHDAESVKRAVQLIRKNDFRLGIQLMIGLPNDSYQKNIETLLKVVRLNPDFVRIYPTLVIKNTSLEKLYQLGEYTPLSLEEAVKRSVGLYKILLKNNIPVIRMGLQPTENIMEGKDVVAGPFHPSFRSLVISEYIYELIVEKIQAFEEVKTVVFRVNNKDISYLVGDKKKNKERLYNVFNLQMKIKVDQMLNRGKIVIETDLKRFEIDFS